MPLHLYNTMTRQVEPFEPADPPNVSLYTCGLTVYNYAHIGNLRTYVFEDILKRALDLAGYRVNHLMNITDVGHLTSDSDTGDDKMEKGAKREGKTAWEIAAYYTEAFCRDLADLHIIEPDIWLKATETIDEQIELVQALEEKGFTYIIDDGVYFDTGKLDDYGKLARLDLEGLRAGHRIDVVEGKRRPTDFALWKFSPPGERRQMEWDSPWGRGFPGWHIECCAMAMKEFGETLDIHCGGIDHVPVHHTNEIAQAEAALGHDWCRWWMHGEFLVLPKGDEAEGGKMAKSAGNFLTLELLMDKGYDPLAYRYFCLNAHYRAQLTFTWEALDGAQTAIRRLRKQVAKLREAGLGEISERYIERFKAAVFDDLAMSRAVAAMWDAIKDDALCDADTYATLLQMDAVLGFGFDTLEPQEEGEAPEEIVEMAERRKAARAEKNFAEADRLRDAIAEKGYTIEDTPEGYKLHAN